MLFLLLEEVQTQNKSELYNTSKIDFRKPLSGKKITFDTSIFPRNI
jgi:hypothetical protein